MDPDECEFLYDDELPAVRFEPLALAVIATELVEDVLIAFSTAASGLKVSFAAALKKRYMDKLFAAEVGQFIESLPTTKE